MDTEVEQKIQADSLLTAAAHRELETVRALLRTVSANVQDAGTGYTPLHALVAGCAVDKVDYSTKKGQEITDGAYVSPENEDEAINIAKLLFENGAIWNDVDIHDETAACIAWRLKMKRMYRIIVDAGVRAEILLNHLAEIEGEEQDNEIREGVQELEDFNSSSGLANTSSKSSPSSHIPDTSEKGNSGDGISRTQSSIEPSRDYIDHWDSNRAFLQSSLRFTPTQLLDASSNAVMMDWETSLMARHADLLLPRTSLRVMNIGHGMGIIDKAIQSHRPREHHIIEAHPAVLAQMKESGWYDKSGVMVHEGRWQDVLPRLIEEGVEVDAIYYDTFAESYADFKALFSEYVIGLLEQEGRFGFYHGLGADRRVCYDVYTSVVELDLKEVGLKTHWEDLSVPEIEWKGVRRPYWNVDIYRLPTCTYL